ncbi:SUMF1/EgtB/PvdO family nonheme iron enzyme [Cohnella fermenti]|uniref:Glycoside hydrolase n=1 Tax=Cohnella fermenti TaxID=2565925 RepID=A0A4V6RXJ3_9BACL|nr:SUMF1/EgtB/PvdO family nonheme iron enzyme [Cohnella fermenti]THF77758.1 hypothetical protein E6C55_15570 [Cohnella fermenti]
MLTELGITMRELAPGKFARGHSQGKYDERPAHIVTISSVFRLSENPITFAQFERFKPGLRDELRKILRWSEENLAEYPEYEGHLGDNDPAVGVTWYDAVAFCEWLSRSSGITYRLPTEAEWEYAALRDEESGEALVSPRNGESSVEEWCLDWYGPYLPFEQTDPGGYRSGITKVTRGASNWQHASSRTRTNRMSFLPAARYPKLGFRIASGKPPATHQKDQPLELHELNVDQSKASWEKTSEDSPVFIPPVDFVRIPNDAQGPVFASHNHFPSITWCPNGDLLAVWFTDPGAGYTGEEGSQLNIAASRLRRGASEWEQASLFYAAADRNDHSASVWTDPEDGRMYHFQGTGSFPKQGNQILFMRTSQDSGATWSYPRIISDKRSMWNPHVVMKTRTGRLVVTSDFNFDQPMWGRIIVSKDGGRTWRQPEGKIVGQHPGIVELHDGRWLAVGRDNWNAEHEAIPGVGVPISISDDEGESWIYRREPSLGRGFNWRQRPVLIRLAEGPLLFVGFTDKWGTPDAEFVNGVDIIDQAGVCRKGFGMFAAISEDDGLSWTNHKLLTPGAESREYDGGGNTEWFTADASHAEPAGYIQAIQAPDGIIHLISSKLHYRFNYAWLRTPTISV